jgi:hypothetical protein
MPDLRDGEFWIDGNTTESRFNAATAHEPWRTGHVLSPTAVDRLLA